MHSVSLPHMLVKDCLNSKWCSLECWHGDVIYHTISATSFSLGTPCALRDLWWYTYPPTSCYLRWGDCVPYNRPKENHKNHHINQIRRKIMRNLLRLRRHVRYMQYQDRHQIICVVVFSPPRHSGSMLVSHKLMTRHSSRTAIWQGSSSSAVSGAYWLGM